MIQRSLDRLGLDDVGQSTSSSRGWPAGPSDQGLPVDGDELRVSGGCRAGTIRRPCACARLRSATAGSGSSARAAEPQLIGGRPLDDVALPLVDVPAGGTIMRPRRRQPRSGNRSPTRLSVIRPLRRRSRKPPAVAPGGTSTMRGLRRREHSARSCHQATTVVKSSSERADPRLVPEASCRGTTSPSSRRREGVGGARGGRPGTWTAGSPQMRPRGGALGNPSSSKSFSTLCLARDSRLQQLDLADAGVDRSPPLASDDVASKNQPGRSREYSRLIMVDLSLYMVMARARPLFVRRAAVHTSRRRNSCGGQIRHDRRSRAQVGRGGAVGAVENREEASAASVARATLVAGPRSIVGPLHRLRRCRARRALRPRSGVTSRRRPRTRCHRGPSPRRPSMRSRRPALRNLEAKRTARISLSRAGSDAVVAVQTTRKLVPSLATAAFCEPASVSLRVHEGRFVGREEDAAEVRRGGRRATPRVRTSRPTRSA